MYQIVFYACPECGYTWEDTITDGVLVGACQCPNCESEVLGVL